MFKNYLQITLRNLFKHKGISFIAIGGLLLGLICTLTIFIYVQSEMDYDTFHKNSKNIYRIAWINENPQTRTPHPMAQTMVQDFPEVEQAVTLSPIWGPGLSHAEFTVKYKDKSFNETGFYSADTTFFKVFTFSMLKGNPETALQTIGGVVITEEIAEKYFGTQEPVGQTLRIHADQNVPLTVTGVIKNIPDNSHFHFDFLVSYPTLKSRDNSSYYEWGDFGHFNYVVLQDGVDPKSVEAKMPEWFLKYNNWSIEGREALLSRKIGFELQPIRKIHLHSHLRWELESNANINSLYLIMAAALFILITVCLNYMNLTTARLSGRTTEIGIRKVLGANGINIMQQFWGESLVVSIIVFALVLAGTTLLIPYFNNIAGAHVQASILFQPLVLALIFIFTALISIMAGGYPSLILSRIFPTSLLKGKSQSGANVAFNRMMVIVQFSISIALIIGISFVYKQLNYMKNKNLGFSSEAIIIVPMQKQELRNQYESIKSELLRDASIISATAVSNVPGSSFNQNSIEYPRENQRIDVSEMRVDHDFFETMDIPIVEGRAFSRKFTTDSKNNFIVNQAAAKQLLMDSAVDEEITWFDEGGPQRGTIVGVAQDFHFQSLHASIEPLLFYMDPGNFGYLLIKLQTQNLSQSLSFVENIWKKFDANQSFEYSFLNKNFQQLYQAEERMQTVLTYFTFLAIFIACLGLHALITYSTQKRFKEIGIRKSLGSTVNDIVYLLCKDFLKWILISNLVAWPLAWFAMNSWLQNFAYKIELSIWPFLMAGLAALAIAMLTVSFQTIKAATANPVEALRYE